MKRLSRWVLAALLLTETLLLPACGTSAPSESSGAETESSEAMETVSVEDLTLEEKAACVSVTQPELIYEDKDMPFGLDGSFCTLRMEDGSMQYWETANGTNVPPFIIYRGTEEDPLQEFVRYFNWDFGDIRHNRASTVWVQNFYQYPDGTLIGFVHREDLADNNDAGTNNFFIGLAISEDNGDHWKYLGDLLGTPMNWKMTPEDGQPNMGGVPYIVCDGYFYIYFNEYISNTTRYISVARISVEETLEKAKEGKLPEAFKYGGEKKGWTVDPMTEYGAMVIKGSSDGCMDTHADSVYCEPLDCYMMTVQTHGVGKLWLFLSEDGVNWSERILVDEVKTGDTMHPYSTFVGLENSSADSSTVGERFYLYFPRKGIGDQYHHDDYYRVEISVNLSALSE